MDWLKKHAVPILGTFVIAVVAALAVAAVAARYAIPLVTPAPKEGAS